MTRPGKIIAHAREALWRRYPALRPTVPKPAPEPGRLILGRDKRGLPFALDNHLLSAHIDLVGGIGGGKSSAMRHLAWLNMEAHPSLNRATIIIDPHGQHPDSLFRTTLRRIVETRLHHGKKVFVIDPNSDCCTGLNLLQGEAEPSVMADHMIEGFERLQRDETLLEKPTLRRALHGLLAVLSELKWSLAQADLLLDPNDPHGIREWALQHINDRYAAKALMRLQYLASDPRLRKEFEIETIGTENRLAPLLSSRAMRAVVGCQMLDMRDVLDEGAVLLVNTAGHNAASETAGDLLGKLVMRTILFAAKRRRMNTLALVFADECARYISQDWERALAELRKYRVGICSAHQTFAMLGAPDDPVRQAIEQIPATKIAFRLNSMQEAALLAPELVKLNLEMPVNILKAPAVVGYELRRMRNANQAGNATRTNSTAATRTRGTGLTETKGTTIGDNMTRTLSRQKSLARSLGHSRADARGEQHSHGSTHSHVESESESDSTGRTMTAGRSRGRGGGTSEQEGSSRGSSFSQSFDVPVDAGSSGEASYGRAAAWGVANARNVTAGYDSGHTTTTGSSANWSESENESEAYSDQHSHTSGVADGIAESETFGSSRVITDTVSESATHGTTEGLSVARGTNRSRNSSAAQSSQQSTGVTAGRSLAEGKAWASGWSETLAPIMKVRPTAVHSLGNVTHMAAEMLCSLPTGVAVVRTIQSGTIEGAIVRVPYRECEPVSDEQYAVDLHAVMACCRIGTSMQDACRSIEGRERELIANAKSHCLPRHEPTKASGFRVPTANGGRRKPPRNHIKRGESND